MDTNYTTSVIDSLNVYVTPVIIVFGLPGNLITTLVFFRTDLKKHSSSFYLGSLAIADACYLIMLLLSLLEFHLQISIYNAGNVACQLLNYAVYVFSNWSVWLIVAFTSERYIALAYPLHRPGLCTVSKARIITFGLFFAACGANLYIIWVSGVDVQGWCTVRHEFIQFSRMVNYFDTLLTFVLPTISVVVLNTLIGRIVSRYRGNVILHRVQDESASASTRSSELKIERQSRRIGSGVSHQSNRNHSVFRERRTMMAHSQCNITKLILLTSTAFLVLNTPSYIIRLVMFAYYFLDIDYPLELIYVQRIVNVLYQANFSVNFLLYAMCGTTFRKALKTFLRKNVTGVKKCLRISPE